MLMEWYEWAFLAAIGLIWIEHFMDWVSRIYTGERTQ